MPALSWYDNMKDRELLRIDNILERLAYEDDLRNYQENKHKYKWNRSEIRTGLLEISKVRSFIESSWKKS
jgi:hypothetical protein